MVQSIGFILGLILVVAGVSLIYAPAGVIVGGSLLAAISASAALNAGEDSKK